MFKIPRIENSEFYLTLAINAMQDKAQVEKQMISKKYSKITKDKNLTKEDYNLRKRKELEIIKIQTLNIKISQYLKKIILKFPKQNKLDEIYVKLINSSQVPFDKLEDAIEKIENMIFEIDVLSSKSIQKIKEVKTQKTGDFIIKKYLGKVSKIFRNNSKTFDTLSISKQFLNKLPKFEDLYTIAIAGFPNVGKSTLMKKISGSNVEIQNYPFTTKGLMFGYLFEEENKCVQLIDTPGLLGRTINNPIEERANIVINDYCQKIVFVIDVTQSCGYSLEKQIDLLKKTSKLKKEIFIYLSKTDLYSNKEKEIQKKLEKEFNKNKIFIDYLELKKELIDSSKDKSKFDINSIKKIS